MPQKLQSPEWTVLSELFPPIHAVPALDQHSWNRQPIKAGDTLFEPGRQCGRFVLLGAGRIRVQMANASGRRMTLYRLVPGNLCIHSIINLINDDRYSLEAVVEAGGWLSWVPGENFHRWMSQSGEFREWILASIGERFQQLLDRSAALAFESVELRLADFLLERMGEDGAVHATQVEIAAELGSAREVILRHLQRFERNGWVRRSRGRLEISAINSLLDLLDPVAGHSSK